MSLLKVGAAPRTSGFVPTPDPRSPTPDDWRSAELHPLITSAPAIAKSDAVRMVGILPYRGSGIGGRGRQACRLLLPFDSARHSIAYKRRTQSLPALPESRAA